MTGDWYKSLLLLMWIAPPVNAVNYWRVWDRLPSRMAVHLDANRQPNGCTSKEGAVMFGQWITATMLAIFSVAMLASRAEAESFVAAADYFWFRAGHDLECEQLNRRFQHESAIDPFATGGWVNGKSKSPPSRLSPRAIELHS